MVCWLSGSDVYIQYIVETTFFMLLSLDTLITPSCFCVESLYFFFKNLYYIKFNCIQYFRVGNWLTNTYIYVKWILIDPTVSTRSYFESTKSSLRLMKTYLLLIQLFLGVNLHWNVIFFQPLIGEIWHMWPQHMKDHANVITRGWNQLSNLIFEELMKRFLKN